ncbi:MAG: alpha/beta hydrolase [Rhodospirillaceae bacterium]|nr:alpha/beta hydrolase [Rhodospirillaceae bacterium]
MKHAQNHTGCALSALILAAGLAACAPVIAPSGPGPATPRLADTSFLTSDGLELAVRRWLPAGLGDVSPPRAVVLAVHGFNDYSKAFDKVPGSPGVGPYLAARGIAVYAYDQRGFGASPHFGMWPGRKVMVRDFVDFVAVLKGLYPDTPLYGLGESMGGAVMMAALARPEPPPLTGAVLAAPAVWARSTMPLAYRGALWLTTHFAPGWKPTGQSLGRMASDNLEMLRDNTRDPLFIKKTRIDAVNGLSDLMDEALAASPLIKLPVLYLYGRNDQIIPKAPTRQALAALTAAGASTRPAYYAGGWHMILRGKESGLVLEDVAAYLSNPAAPLPSGADVDAVARLEAAKD